MKHELALADSNGVAGIVTALIARNDIKVRRENVDNLAFAFVAPLGSDYDDVFHNIQKPHTPANGKDFPKVAFLNRTRSC